MGVSKRTFQAAGFRGGGGAPISITVTGDKKIDKLLRNMISENGAKSFRKEFRKLTRKACKDIVLPEAKRLVPEDEGFLESQLVVRSTPRSRKWQGHYVGFQEELYTGDTFYGGFIEFGFHHHRAGFIPADSFLRRPLYTNEYRIRGLIKEGFSLFVKGIEH